MRYFDTPASAATSSACRPAALTSCAQAFRLQQPARGGALDGEDTGGGDECSSLRRRVGREGARELDGVDDTALRTPERCRGFQSRLFRPDEVARHQLDAGRAALARVALQRFEGGEVFRVARHHQLADPGVPHAARRRPRIEQPVALDAGERLERALRVIEPAVDHAAVAAGDALAEALFRLEEQERSIGSERGGDGAPDHASADDDRVGLQPLLPLAGRHRIALYHAACIPGRSRTFACST